MAISTNASYIPTINEFLAHWVQADAALPGGLTILTEDGVSVSFDDFGDTRDALQVQATTVIDTLNDQQIARGDIDLQKAKLLLWLGEFNGLVDAYWLKTPFHNARPLVPGISEGEQNFLDPMRDMGSLWKKLNAGTAPGGLTLPLKLADGTTMAQFVTAYEALQVAYATEATAAQAVVLARAKRDEIKAIAYATMKAYRVALPARLVLFPAIIATLPRLTPLPGHTPAAVNASAVFVPPDQSKIVHAASVDGDLERYELRGNPGTSYDENDAVVVASHTPAEAREFLTDFALTQPGAKVAYKLYVVLTSGNEAGSSTMLVQRPV